MIPPEALPNNAELLDLRISALFKAAGFIKSKAVLPSGSVSGIPSTKTRIPLVVPALDRSPAPLAPNPLIVSLKS